MELIGIRYIEYFNTKIRGTKIGFKIYFMFPIISFYYNDPSNIFSRRIHNIYDNKFTNNILHILQEV